MAQVLFAKSTIDDAGNIQVHGRGGLRLTYQRQMAGVAQNISGDALFFEIAGLARIALLPGSDATKRVILVESPIIAQIALRQPVAFALRDETYDPVVTRWDGYITSRGFAAAPPVPA